MVCGVSQVCIRSLSHEKLDGWERTAVGGPVERPGDSVGDVEMSGSKQEGKPRAECEHMECLINGS